MKFQCETCGKYYLIENAEDISRKQTLRCIECGNLFFLQKDLAFSSASRNSKLVCGRCGSLVDEEGGVCTTCNPALNSLREELRIDSKDYEFFVVRNGRLRPKRGKRGRGRAALLAGASVVLVAAAAFFLLPGGKSAVLKLVGHVNRTEIQVVIMRSGQTYYAGKIEREGASVKIVEKNGIVVTVDEKDVLQIAKAVLEE